jgi:integrase
MHLSTSAQLKIERGFYMGGIVSPDQTSCSCKGKFIKKVFLKEEFWVCGTCEAAPSLYRVRRYLPSIGGEKGKAVEIRYDQNGRRLRDRDSARATMKYIDGLIESGKFDPAEFQVKDANNNYLFSNFVKNIYLPHYAARVEAKTLKKNTLVAKEGFINNYILPYFTGVKLSTDKKTEEKVPWASSIRSVKQIHDGTIDMLRAALPTSPRHADMIIEEFRTLVNFAYKQKYIDKPIQFGKIKKPKLKNPELLLSQSDQRKVLELVDDQTYKTMLSIMCFIAIRPSEVRALKWQDWDYKNGKLWIRRHVGYRDQIEPGRKSNDDVHFIALSKELLTLIEYMPRSIRGDEFMFKGKLQEIVSEHCLSRAWKRAMKLAKLPHVDSYRGSKSSCMSNWLRSGYSVSMISQFTGLTEEDVRRYAQHNDESLMKTQIKMMEG